MIRSLNQSELWTPYHYFCTTTLIELGYEEDVRLLVTLGQQYLNARKPGAKAGVIKDDPVLSTHVEK